VNPTSGALTLASTVTLGSLTSLPWLGDVVVAANGLYLYVALWGPPSSLDVLTIGSGCTLTLASQLTNQAAAYVSIALLGSQGLMAVDFQQSHIDIYSITQGTQLKLVTSKPSSLYSPLGAAAIINAPPASSYVLNADDGLEAHALSAKGVLGPVSGSPAEDPCWCTSANVFYDQANAQIVVSEQDSLGIYAVQGGKLTFLSQASLASGDDAPSAMAELGADLFVVNTLSNTVDSCAMSAGSATCSLAATLPTGGYPQGIGVL
jgi:hypothetical protein